MHPKYTQLALGERAKGRALIERVCPVCGESFAVQPSVIKNGRGKTCSPACQYTSNRTKALQRHYPQTSPRIEITCAVCGKVFDMTRAEYEYRSRTFVPQYCSRRCSHDSPEWKRNLGESLRNSEAAKAARARAIPAMNADAHTPEGRARRRRQTLAQMSNPEQRKAWEEGIRRRTESPEWRASKHFQRGPAHPRYNGGKTDRLVDRGRYAAKQWRKDVLKRDDYTCRACGVRGGRLNAHHIKPWVSFPELRDELSNGITLCEPCHLAVHRGEVTL